MNSVLLLTAALIFSTATMSAQQANIRPANLGTQQQVSEARSTDAAQNMLGAGPSLASNAASDPMMLTSDKNFVADTVCYTMRSYVVARDSKHSDAVHPAGYSTCQPASKYRLRTTQMTPGSANR